MIKKTQIYKGKIVHRTARAKDMGNGVQATFGTSSDAVSGAGPFTHTLTPKANRDSWTVQATYQPSNSGAVVGQQVVDCQFHTMKITGESGMPIQVEYDFAGISGSSLSTTPTATYDAGSGALIYWGGTFNVDGATTGTVAPFVRKFEYLFSYPLDENIQTEKVTVDALVSTQRTISVKYELLFQDLTQYKKVYWNAGTADAFQIGSGSIDLTFLPDGVVTSGHSLEIKVPQLNYSAAKVPAAKLDGKALWQNVEGTAITGASPISTIILINAQSGALPF